MIKLSNIERHLLLYAKGWYRKSEDVFADLKKIVGKLIALDPAQISSPDIIHFLFETLYTLEDEKGQKIFWQQFIEKTTKPFNVNLEPPFRQIKNFFTASSAGDLDVPLSKIMAEYNAKIIISSFLSYLHNLRIKEKIDLGKPDTSLLPLSKKRIDY